jgi:hypothetical protein
MSTIAIISDNPTTWNRPGWKDNSCYANASLWALLYNDAYKLFINDTKIKKEITDLKKEVTKEDGTKEEKILATVDVLNSNKKIVKDNLINFQNAIQNYSTRINSSVILDYTTAIRGALSKITGNNDLLRNFFSPDEFLGIIGTVFVNNPIIKINSSSDTMVFPIITLTPDYTIENTSDKNITTSYKNPDTSTSYVLENQLIIDYPKLGLSSDVVVEGSFNELAGQHSEKFYSIGQYKLYAFVHWQGGSHYVCYFEFNNEWYQFDDYTNNHNGSIKKVLNLKDSEIYNESFLFFYKFDNTLSLNTNVTITEYLQTGGNALIITNNATKLEDSEQPQPPARQISQPGAAKSSSSSSSAAPAAPGTTFISSIQVANNCEKYGQDWLDLFIDENALPGTLTVRRYQNKNNNKNNNNNIKLASFTNEKTGKLTTINVPQNCTFTPEKPGSNTGLPQISRSLSNSSSDTLIEEEVFNSDEISENIKDLDLKKVYTTVNANNTSSNGASKPVFIVVKDSSGTFVIENKYLHSNGDINTSENDDSTKDDLTAAEGIFLDMNVAETFIKNLNLGKEADKALNKAKTNLSQIINDNVRTKIDASSDNDIVAYPYDKNIVPTKESLEELGNLVYFGGNVYVAGYLGSDLVKITLYNVSNNEICDLDGTKISDYTDGTVNFTLIEAPVALDENALRQQAINDITNFNNNVTQTKINQANNNPLRQILSDPNVFKESNIYFDDISKHGKDNSYLNTYPNKSIIISTKKIEKSKKEGDSVPAGTYYMVYTDTDKITKNKIKGLINLRNNKIVKQNGYDGKTSLSDKIPTDPTTTVKDISKIFIGGTRRKKNRNINSGTRKEKVNLRKGRKTRKGKRTRKLIRNKNKLNTNKLRTNKLRTNKLRTNKLTTRKLELNKRRTRKA